MPNEIDAFGKRNPVFDSIGRVLHARLFSLHSLPLKICMARMQMGKGAKRLHVEPFPRNITCSTELVGSSWLTCRCVLCGMDEKHIFSSSSLYLA